MEPARWPHRDGSCRSLGRSSGLGAPRQERGRHRRRVDLQLVLVPCGRAEHHRCPLDRIWHRQPPCRCRRSPRCTHAAGAEGPPVHQRSTTSASAWRRGSGSLARSKQQAGKSTLLRIIAGITEPTRGTIAVRGRLGALLDVGAGFHAELSGRDNIELVGAIMGMPRHLVRERFEQIVQFAEVTDALDLPIKHYSSGMYLRLRVRRCRAPRCRSTPHRRGLVRRRSGLPATLARATPPVGRDRQHRPVGVA